MKAKTHKISRLNEITSAYKTVLFDTSALIGTRSLYHGERPENYDEMEFAPVLENHLRNGSRPYIIEEVRGEYLVPNEYSTEFEERTRINLMKTFEDEERILKLNQGEVLEYKNYLKTLSKFTSFFGMSGVDTAVFITSLVLLKTRESCAIITNDKHIMDGWADYRKTFFVPRSCLGLAIRRELNKFDLLC